MEPLVLELARIEHGAAAEAFPQHPHMAAWNGHRHVREEHDPHERQDHQVDHETRQMAVDKPPPPGSRRGGFPSTDHRYAFIPVLRAEPARRGHSSISGVISIQRASPRDDISESGNTPGSRPRSRSGPGPAMMPRRPSRPFRASVCSWVWRENRYALAEQKPRQKPCFHPGVNSIKSRPPPSCPHGDHADDRTSRHLSVRRT